MAKKENALNEDVFYVVEQHQRSLHWALRLLHQMNWDRMFSVGLFYVFAAESQNPNYSLIS